MESDCKRTRSSRRSHAGFTLIELLIVVAIVAILAAIAVMNFAEVSVRSKIARVKYDLHTFTYGLEAFHVDNSNYPYIGDATTLEERTSRLTTPIGYFSSIPKDPFGDEVEESIVRSNEYRTYEYVTDRDWYHHLLFQHPQGWGFRQVVQPNADYYIVSQGPDLVPNPFLQDPELFFLAYDPTNGTTSPGDIFRSGPGFSYHGG